MRKIRITTAKRQLEMDDNTILICPVQTGGGYLHLCTEKCAWFRVKALSTDRKKQAFCGDRLIGELINS